MIYRSLIKPSLDFVLALFILLAVLPIFLMVAVLLFFANDGKVFFFQERPGKNERVFRIVKFKSMNDRRDPSGALLPDSERLTPVGRFVRKTSLDELPQLLNVLKGDMSFVGPRPLLVSYLSLYNEEQRKRHRVKPGLTGWAQVNGRNAISWEQKFAYDVWYVEHMGAITDLRIMLLTLKKVFIREGISSGTSATMEPFTGTD